MIGGIDQQIQQKVDAYRGNPQQLMQRYQQNQELIDLLALQKLKSEKDAAAREMQMQMQTTPQTVKQQREAELLGRTKDEMVQQTSGIMQQRQKRQQQNMQRTANQGLPQLPAGNMQRMAGGGIVAFAEGGDVDARMRQLIEAALELGESPEALAERLKDNPNALAILRSMQSQQVDRPRQASMGERPAEAMSIPDRAPSIDTTDIASLLGPKETARPERAAAEQRPVMSPRLASEAGMMSGPLATPPAPKEGGGLSSLLGGSGAIDPVQRRKEREAALAPREQQAEEAMAQRGQQRQKTLESSPLGGRLFEDNRLDSQLQEIDPSTIPERLPTPATQPATQPAPSQQQMDQLQEIDTSGLAGLKKASLTPRESYEASRSVLSKELLRQQDPEKLRKERLRDFLIGAGGRSSFGSVMAGGAAASANRQAQQEAQKLKGIGSLMGVDENLMKMDYDQAKLATEERSAEALESLRTMQSDTQRFNVVDQSYAEAKAVFRDALMQNPEYKNATDALEEAEKGGLFGGVDEAEVNEAKRRVAAIEDRIKATMPSFVRLENLRNELIDRMGGMSSQGAQGAGGSTEGYTVERVQQ